MLTRPVERTLPRLLAGALFSCCLAAAPATAGGLRHITVSPAQPTSADTVQVQIDTYCCSSPLNIVGLEVEVLPRLIRITADRFCGPLSAVAPYVHAVALPPLDPGDYRIEYWTEGTCASDGPEVTGRVTVAPAGPVEPDPEPPYTAWITSPEAPGFRFQVRITAGDLVFEGHQELLCQPETVCVSGAVPWRSEAFFRILGPRLNGYYWPTVIRFTPSRVEAWIEELATGIVRYYRLPEVPRGTEDLSGRQDRTGFAVP